MAAILFGGQGMHASDAVAGFQLSWGVRVGFFSAWVVATLPVARTLLGHPTSFYLRPLPVPRAWFWAVVAAQLVVAEAPWIALWGIGAGAVAGAAAATSTAAMHALLLAGRAERRLEVLAPWAGAAALAALVVTGPPPWALASAGAAALALAVPAAWRRAPEWDARHRRRAVAGPAPVALARAYLVPAWRGARGAMTRAALVCGAGGAVTALVARNHGLTGALPIGRLALGMGAASLPVAVGGVVAAIHTTERGARWLLAASSSAARAGPGRCATSATCPRPAIRPRT